jgi:hypothetical protein
MQEAHRKAAEQHELAAREHRTAAECNENWNTERRSGIPNERWSTRITPTSSHTKAKPSQGR